VVLAASVNAGHLSYPYVMYDTVSYVRTVQIIRYIQYGIIVHLPYGSVRTVAGASLFTVRIRWQMRRRDRAKRPDGKDAATRATLLPEGKPTEEVTRWFDRKTLCPTVKYCTVPYVRTVRTYVLYGKIKTKN
jgi:hypothetical protein